jgi:hypothetical protein
VPERRLLAEQPSRSNTLVLTRDAIIILRNAAAAVLLGATVTGGCSGTARQGREQAVFHVQTNIRLSQRANVGEIVDVGLETFANTTSQPVTVRSIRLVQKPGAVHLVSVSAFSCRLMNGCVFTTIGDMTRECPRQFKPILLNTITVPAHKTSDKQPVVAIRVSQPGRYFLGRVRIDYTTNGQRGWQYQNLWFTAIIVNPPRPGGQMKPCP